MTKGCVSPTPVYAKTACSYTFRNVTDEAFDTLTVFGLTDVVHAAGGDKRSGDVFRQLRMSVGAFLPGFSAPPICTGVGMTGNGTVENPWVGATSCTLPYGSRINVQSFSWYTVQPADFGRPLSDDVYVDWHDLCTGVSNNCNPNPPPTGAGSVSAVTQNPSTTTTEVHNAANAVVTTVAAGSTVHDFVAVTGVAGSPPPTGTVRLEWFTNRSCTGTPAATAPSITLGSGGTVDATGFPQGPLAVGQYGYRAHYLGDPTTPAYATSDGPCEPLDVVDANIKIAPPNKDNPVGTNHVLTITATALGGTLDAGPHTAKASIVSGDPGSFVGEPTCTYTGGGASASCTVTITSKVVGTTHVSATSDIPVNGVTITRTTGTEANAAAGGSANAIKNWLESPPNKKTTPSSPLVTIRTDIHDESHAVITFVGGSGPSVFRGEVVHDKAFVKKGADSPAAAPNPTGKVTFHRYSTSDCTGPVAENETVVLAANGTAESRRYALATDTSYTADYLGDANYPAVKGICERLRPLLLPAGITIAKCPKTDSPCVKRDAGDPRDLQEVLKGETATFRIRVTNTSGSTLVNVTVTDQLSPGCERALGTMAAGTSTEYACTQPGVQAGYTNVARVVGRSGARSYGDRDPSRVRVPAIEIAKCRLVAVCIKGRDDQQIEGADLTADFTITVTNTGGAALHDVTVTDPVAPECNNRGYTKSRPLLPGKSWTYTCTHTRAAAVKTDGSCGYLNVASVVGTSPLGTNVRDSDSSSVQHPGTTNGPPPCGTG